MATPERGEESGRATLRGGRTHGSRRRRGTRAALALLGILLPALADASTDCPTPDLLAGRAPAWSARVDGANALTDGHRPPAGRPVPASDAARFAVPFGTAVWDLGARRRIRGLFLEAHGESRWEIAVSDDGIRWRPLWEPRMGEETSRLLGGLDERARWVRLAVLRAAGGQGRASELQALCEPRDAPVADSAAPAWSPPPRLRALAPVVAVLAVAILAAGIARRRALAVPFDPASRGWSVATAALLGASWLYAVLFFRHAGFNVDEFVQEQYGRELVGWYRALLAGHYRPFEASVPGLNLYGGFFEIGADLVGRVSPLPLTETRHLVTALFGSLGLVGAFLLGRQLGSRATGFCAALALAATPRFVGHFFTNPKDVPFAVCHVFVLVCLVASLRHLPRLPLRWVAALGGSVGALVGTRVGGVIVLPYLALGAAAWVAAEHVRGRRIGRSGAGDLLRSAAGVAAVAWLVTMVSWPWVWRAAVLGPLQALVHFHDTAKSYGVEFTVFFEGRHIPYSQLPGRYTLEWLAIALPDFFLLAAPAAAIVWRRRRPPQREPDDASRIGLAVVAASAVTPLALSLSGSVSQFDSLRHFLFVLPPLAVLLALLVTTALARAPGWARAGLLVAGAGLVGLAFWDAARLHPYEYVYFNRSVAGGLSTASKRYETDYLGLSHEAGVAWLLEHYPARSDGPLRVSSCPGFSVNVEKPLRDAGPRADGLVYTPAQASGHSDVALASRRSNCFTRFHGRLVGVIQRDGVPLLFVIEQRTRTDASAGGGP